MLVLELDRLFQLRAIKQKRSFLVNHGFSDNEARLLVSGETKAFKLSTVERLCSIFNCTPDDLFDWKGDENHPLCSLKKHTLPTIERILSDRSPKEIEAVLEELAKRKGEGDD